MSVLSSATTPDRPAETPRRGRPPGVKNKRTREMAELVGSLVPKAKRTLLKLLESTDPELALKSATLILAYYGGRPPEAKTVQVGGIPGQPIATDATVRTLDLTGAALRLANMVGMPVQLAGRAVPVPDALAEEIDAPALSAASMDADDNGLHNPLHEAARRIAWLIDRGGVDLTERLASAAQLPSPAAQDDATPAADGFPLPDTSEPAEAAGGDPEPSAGMADADAAPPFPPMSILMNGAGWTIGATYDVQPVGADWQIERIHDRRVMGVRPTAQEARDFARHLVAIGEC